MSVRRDEKQRDGVSSVGAKLTAAHAVLQLVGACKLCRMLPSYGRCSTSSVVLQRGGAARRRVKSDARGPSAGASVLVAVGACRVGLVS
jgi:hypothetical protein